MSKSIPIIRRTWPTVSQKAGVTAYGLPYIDKPTQVGVVLVTDDCPFFQMDEQNVDQVKNYVVAQPVLKKEKAPKPVPAPATAVETVQTMQDYAIVYLDWFMGCLSTCLVFDANLNVYSMSRSIVNCQPKGPRDESFADTIARYSRKPPRSYGGGFNMAGFVGLGSPP